MNLNPEFERQLWLEFPRSRLVGVPLVLGVVLTLAYFLDDYRFAAVGAKTSYGLFLLIVSWWGARQAVDSVLDEQRNRTWDTQRLSALGPWSMVWGKLFGSTLVVWYGAFVCLAVFGLSTPNPANLPWFFSHALVGGLALQNFSFLLSLLALRKGQGNGGGIIVLATLIALSFGPWMMRAAIEIGVNIAETVEWYGLSMPVQAVSLSALCVALFWCGVGNYRLMAQELRLRSPPWAWLAFALFLSLYLAGFVPTPPALGPAVCLVGFGVCLTLTYLDLLAELNEPMRFKRLLTYVTQRDWRRAGEELPPWCVTLALAAVFSLPLSVLLDYPNRSDGPWHAYPSSMLLLTLRDIGIFLLFSYGKNPRRALVASLLCAVLLYGVIPGIFEAAHLPGLAAVFFPLRADSAVVAFVCAGAQTFIALGLAYTRWRGQVYRQAGFVGWVLEE